MKTTKQELHNRPIQDIIDEYKETIDNHTKNQHYWAKMNLEKGYVPSTSIQFGYKQEL